MRLFISMFNFFSFIALILMTIAGFFTPDFIPHSNHIGIGLMVIFIAVLALSLMLFYFITAGTNIKENYYDGKVAIEELDILKNIKKKLFPWIILSITFLILISVSGGAYLSGYTDYKFLHTATTIATVWIFYITITKGRKFILVQFDILKKIYKKKPKDLKASS